MLVPGGAATGIFSLVIFEFLFLGGSAAKVIWEGEFIHPAGAYQKPKPTHLKPGFEVGRFDSGVSQWQPSVSSLLSRPRTNQDQVEIISFLGAPRRPFERSSWGALRGPFQRCPQGDLSKVVHPWEGAQRRPFERSAWGA